MDLVLAGKTVVPIPDHPRIRHVGFITEEEKVAALRQCRLLVIPSPYESLSVITLEAWKLGVPVLANARCKVLMGQCLRSNGGLFYQGYAEFAEALAPAARDAGPRRVARPAGAGVRRARVLLGHDRREDGGLLRPYGDDRGPLNPLLKLLPKPDRDAFARRVADAFAATGVAREAIRYDAEQFEIKVEDFRCFLGNAHRQACFAWPWERGGIVRSLVALRTLGGDAGRPTLADVRDRLLPGVRHVWGLEAIRLGARLEGGEGPQVPGFGLGPWLQVALFVDHENSTAMVGSADLARWGLTFEEAYDRALGNLKARSSAPFVAIGEGLYHSPWQDCYDPARLLLRDALAPLDLSGDPVVGLPSWHHLLVTGSDDAAGIAAVVAFALKVMEEEPKTLSALPLVRRGGEWVGLELPRGHAAEPLLRKARVMELSGIYAEQKALLDRVHEAAGADAFVATYLGSRNEQTDDHTSSCVWVRKVPSLLPRTECIQLFDSDRPEAERVLARVDWDIVQLHCGELLRPTADAVPRFRVESFPPDEAIAAMAAAQARRDAAAAGDGSARNG